MVVADASTGAIGGTEHVRTGRHDAGAGQRRRDGAAGYRDADLLEVVLARFPLSTDVDLEDLLVLNALRDVAPTFARGGLEAHGIRPVLLGVQIDQIDIGGVAAVQFFRLEPGVGGAIDGAVVCLAGSSLSGLVLKVCELRIRKPLRKEEAVVNDRAGHLVR